MYRDIYAQFKDDNQNLKKCIGMKRKKKYIYQIRSAYVIACVKEKIWLPNVKYDSLHGILFSL